MLNAEDVVQRVKEFMPELTDEEAEVVARGATEETSKTNREDVIARRMCLGFSRSAASDGIAEAYEEQSRPFSRYDDICGVEIVSVINDDGQTKYITKAAKHRPSWRITEKGRPQSGKGPGGTPCSSGSNFPYVTGPFTNKSAGRKRRKPKPNRFTAT